MSCRATVLRDSRHRDFLQSQRRDPVTHEAFMAGDRVTRCASCLSPFLQQSWDAIGRTHCGQVDCVGLDDVEPSPPRATTEEDRKKKHTGPEATSIELAPIAIELAQVPITLR